MKRLNDYFFSIGQKKDIKQKISMCGKLEAILGNYFLSGAGNPDSDTRILYYDSKVGSCEPVPLITENIVAYIFETDHIAFVREDMLPKVQNDTEEYELLCIPVVSFEADELCIDTETEIPNLFRKIIWIDDDFLSDENIEFDFEAFDMIDSGVTYINPNHFSVMDLFCALQRYVDVN